MATSVAGPGDGGVVPHPGQRQRKQRGQGRPQKCAQVVFIDPILQRLQRRFSGFHSVRGGRSHQALAGRIHYVMTSVAIGLERFFARSPLLNGPRLSALVTTNSRTEGDDRQLGRGRTD